MNAYIQKEYLQNSKNPRISRWYHLPFRRGNIHLIPKDTNLTKSVLRSELFEKPKMLPIISNKEAYFRYPQWYNVCFCFQAHKCLLSWACSFVSHIYYKDWLVCKHKGEYYRNVDVFGYDWTEKTLNWKRSYPRLQSVLCKLQTIRTQRFPHSKEGKRAENYDILTSGMSFHLLQDNENV